jgi:hypothetical protein
MPPRVMKSFISGYGNPFRMTVLLFLCCNQIVLRRPVRPTGAGGSFVCTAGHRVPDWVDGYARKVYYDAEGDLALVGVGWAGDRGTHTFTGGTRPSRLGRFSDTPPRTASRDAGAPRLSYHTRQLSGRAWAALWELSRHSFCGNPLNHWSIRLQPRAD